MVVLAHSVIYLPPWYHFCGIKFVFGHKVQVQSLQSSDTKHQVWIAVSFDHTYQVRLVKILVHV